MCFGELAVLCCFSVPFFASEKTDKDKPGFYLFDRGRKNKQRDLELVLGYIILGEKPSVTSFVCERATVTSSVN